MRELWMGELTHDSIMIIGRDQVMSHGGGRTLVGQTGRSGRLVSGLVPRRERREFGG